jgi:cysteine desulfurase
MDMDFVYLDYAATTPAAKEVVDAMIPFFAGAYGNPSSNHALGSQAKEAVEDARAAVARFIGARPNEIFFNSGGSEANNTAVKGIAFANRRRGNHLIVSSIEHRSVLDACSFLEKEGFRVTCMPVNPFGTVDPDEVLKAITKETILISIMHANNEVGAIEPIAGISRIARANRIYFHTDAVQTLGHIPVNVDDLGVDLLSASAHKFYGPKGIGLLYVRTGVEMSSLIHGGSQEEDRRAGTENVPGIIGFAKAVQVADRELVNDREKILRLDRMLRDGLAEIPGISFNGHPTERLPGYVNITVDSADGEALLFDLRLEGICASNGSACDSSSTEPSHVLLALGLPARAARNSLRFTLGRQTSDADIEKLLQVMPSSVNRCRKTYNPYL